MSARRTPTSGRRCVRRCCAAAALAIAAVVVAPPGRAQDPGADLHRRIEPPARVVPPGNPTPGPPAAAPRARIALVLSGGGARGMAHVGVLKALERMRVPVDLVVGTSIGAAIGGAWAAGATVDGLERFVRETDWEAILADRPPRASTAFRRRQDDLDVPSRIELGIGRAGLIAPSAAISGQGLEAALRDALPPGASGRSGASLPVPFAAVATDLLTGDAVVLGAEPLDVAIRASVAVPGLLAPFRHEGRLLVDGGLVDNLPVEVARRLGAEVVIAVNAGEGPADGDDPRDAVDVARRMLSILTDQNVAESIGALGERDLLVTPRLGAMGTLALREGARAIVAGERAVLELADRLAPLALEADVYADVVRHRLDAVAPPAPKTLARVRVVGTRRADPDGLAAESGLRPGRVATLDEIRAAADRLYGRGDFERVDAAVDDTPDGRVVTLSPVESDWRSSRLRLGLQLATNFRDTNAAQLAMLHVLPWLNAWGGEVRTLLRAGTVLDLRTEWWQPLGPGSPWYATAAGSYGSGTETLYRAWRPFVRTGLRGLEARAAVGRRLGDLGIAELGLARRADTAGLRVPDPLFVPGGADTAAGSSSDVRDVYSSTTALLSIDTVEPLAFPASGGLLRVEAARRLERSTPGVDRVDVAVAALRAARLGSWAGHVLAEWTSGPTSVGGFLRSSGLPTTLSAGRSTLLLRGVAGLQVGTMPALWGGSVRVGGSFEWLDVPGWSELGVRGSVAGGSAFAAVDTRLGPLYFGLGYTRGFAPVVHLILGPVW